ncbi:DUF2079 domain-containing protein [Spirilliplanes yamanashiensis]
MALGSLALALWITHDIWADPVNHTIGNNSGDHAFFEWLLGYGSWVVTHGADPFYADVLNNPLGVNLAVNTSITVYALAFAPITMAFGPSVSFVAILTLNLACGAFAWYWLLTRHIAVHPAAAVLAGLFGGFAPGYISHANGHLNWSAAWVAPVLLCRVLTLRTPGRWLRNGLILGVLVAIAFSVAAEGLFFTALACGVFLGTWALHPAGRAEARAALPTLLAALGVAAVTAAALLAYPLWLHFAGPQSFKGTGFRQSVHAEDLLAYVAWPARSLAGAFGMAGDFAPNPTEETSFFGLPLVLVVIGALVLLRRGATPGRRATLTALAVTAGLFTLLSFGPRVKLGNEVTDIPLPYALLGKVPLFDAALPARLALVVTGVVTVVLGLLAHRLIADPPKAWARVAGAAALVLALLPIAPIPLLYAQRAPVPQFITEGTWRRYVADGTALAPLPLTSDDFPDGQRWQAIALADAGRREAFHLPAGYFLGPGGRDEKGRIGAPERPTTVVFGRAAKTGRVPAITNGHRANARADLAYWNVSTVILADQVSGAFYPVNHGAVFETATLLWGPPTRVQDVWLWNVA